MTDPGNDDPLKVAADATSVDEFPDYIIKRDSKGNTTWIDEQVELFDMSFLGVRFDTGHFINDELSNRLKEAQKVLYKKCLREKQQEREEKQKEQPDKPLPPITTLSEVQFRQWCWDGQEPFDANGTPSILPHGGLKDIKNPASRHSSGSAFDTNLATNPYIPTRSPTHPPQPPGFTLGGEIQPVPKGFPSDVRRFHEDNIWKPALAVFDRAHALFYGVPADLSTELKTDKAEETYRRFKSVSYAVGAYFQYAYLKGISTTLAPLSRQQFETSFISDFNDGLMNPDAPHVDGTKLFAGLNSAQRSKVLDEYYQAIVADRRTVQLAIISGNIVIGLDGSLSFPQQNQRDPCRGIFNFRQEAFVELVKTQKLRWGGAMFGDLGSGDVQHFDLDLHFVNGKKFTVSSPDHGKTFVKTEVTTSQGGK
jgi:hypothetical protein